MYRNSIYVVALGLSLSACGSASTANSASPSDAAFNEALYSNLDASTDSMASDAMSPLEALKKRAEADVRGALKDPASAQFKAEIASTGGACVMGQVLSRNGFGGFTGYQGFVWTDGTVVVQDSDQQQWMKAQSACFGAIADDAKKYIAEQKAR